MGASKQDFIEQRQYEEYDKQELIDAVEILQKRIIVKDSHIKCLQSTINILEELVKQNKISHDFELNQLKK